MLNNNLSFVQRIVDRCSSPPRSIIDRIGKFGNNEKHKCGSGNKLNKCTCIHAKPGQYEVRALSLKTNYETKETQHNSVLGDFVDVSKRTVLVKVENDAHCLNITGYNISHIYTYMARCFSVFRLSLNQVLGVLNFFSNFSLHLTIMQL